MFQGRVGQLRQPFPALIAWAICLTGTIFYGYEYILRIEPSIMQSQLRQYFDIATAGSWGSLVGLFYLAYTPMQIPAGPITDHWGPRRVLTAALSLCVSGLFLFYITPNAGLAGIGRFMVGLGSAFAYIGACRLAVIWLPPRRFALFSGLTIGTGMLGAISGNMLLSNMVHTVGWYRCLQYTFILGVLLLPVIWFTAQDDYESNFKHNKIGLGQMTKQLASIFAYGQVWAAGLIACFLYVALSGFGELWGPVTLQYIYHFDPEQAGDINSSVFWGALVGAPFAGWFSDFVGRRKMPLLVACLACLTLTLLIFYLPIHNTLYISTLLFLYGFFAGFEIISFAVGREYIGARFSGTAIAFVNMLTMMSGLIYQPLIGWIVDFIGTGEIVDNIHVYTPASYQKALGIIPLSLVIASLLCVFILKETYGKPVDEQ